jgi:hypothetical protein
MEAGSPPCCRVGRLSLDLSGAEVGEYGKNATVAVLAVGQVELGEDVTDVSLDRSLAQDQTFGDACVGQALRHQREHLALPLCELGERVTAATSGDEARDHVRVKGGASSGDALRGGQELVDFEHTSPGLIPK